MRESGGVGRDREGRMWESGGSRKGQRGEDVGEQREEGMERGGCGRVEGVGRDREGRMRESRGRKGWRGEDVVGGRGRKDGEGKMWEGRKGRTEEEEEQGGIGWKGRGIG